MARTFKNLFPEILTFRNLLEAARRAQQGKRYRESTLVFNFRLEEELLRLGRELADGTYRPGPYRDFIVHDMKRRVISAALYRDRVVHHAVMRVVEPLFDRSLIEHTYACRKGKGTHAALAKFRALLARHRYVLKCDIRKYFQSIDHEILKSLLARRIADRRLMALLSAIIDSRHEPAAGPPMYYPGDDLFTPLERRRGIPIGNLTSQFFATLYLDGFDHWVTERLRAGPYLRYTDDFCLFGDDKARLREARAAIIERLASLRLSLHDGKSRVYTVKEGVDYLGFRHLAGTVRVRKEATKRFRKRVRRLERGLAAGLVSRERVRASIVSWTAHAAYGNSRELCRKIVPASLAG